MTESFLVGTTQISGVSGDDFISGTSGIPGNPSTSGAPDMAWEAIPSTSGAWEGETLVLGKPDLNDAVATIATAEAATTFLKILLIQPS